MTRYLALDLGERRIGLAVGDDAGGLATPLPSLRRRSHRADVDALRATVRDERAEVLLIGLPLTLRGEEGPQAGRARSLGERLASDLGMAHEYLDERLTTSAAERLRSGRRFDVDSAAAALLLQQHLDRRRVR